MEEKQISAGLKTTFLVHAIVGTIVGLAYLLIPTNVGDLLSWPVGEEGPYRLVGAAILGFAASSWLAYRETVLEKVRIVVQMEIVWTVLATLVMLWGLLLASTRFPGIAWVFAVVFALFAIAFAFFYYRD